MLKKLIQNVILIFLVIALLFAGYSKFVRKDCLVKFAGYSFLIVLTESMEPTIVPKELILIKECASYELGDIVTYQSMDGTFITHRILQMDGFLFIAKGDKNEVTDSSTSLETIQGKVIFHSKILGIFVTRYLKIVIIACFAIWAMMSITKLIKEKQYEEK